MIESFKNEKIKEFLKLKNNKKYRKDSKKFTIEGVRLIFEAVQQNIRLHTVFITQKCQEKIENTNYDIVKFKETKKFNLMRISEEVAKKISSVESSQGIFAVVGHFSYFKKEKIEKNSLVLALYEISDPGNLGTLLRSAYSFGFMKVVLYRCCEIYNEKVIRSSMGSIFRLSFLECENFKVFIEFLNSKQIESFAAVLEKDSKSSEFLNNKQGVLILGNEARGLPSFVSSSSKHKIKIKINKKFESLNVSCAGSILMYEMSKNNKILS